MVWNEMEGVIITKDIKIEKEIRRRKRIVIIIGWGGLIRWIELVGR